MFHPEFRYLIQQDNNVEEDRRHGHVLAGMTVVLVNTFLLGAFVYGLYESISLSVNAGGKLTTEIWNALSPNCKWIETIVFITSGAVCVLLIIGMSIMADIYEKSLKTDNNKIEALTFELNNVKNKLNEVQRELNETQRELEETQQELKKSERKVKK
jgi:sensor histidine kinase YesM